MTVTDTDPPVAGGLAGLMDRAARAHPDQVVADGTETLTYADLAQRSRTMATTFARHGVGAGDRVLVYTGKSAGALAALFAAVRIGAIAVPLAGNLKDRHLQHMVVDAKPSLMVVDTPERRRRGMAATSHTGSSVKTLDELVATTEAPLQAPAPQAPAVIFYTSGSTGWPKGVIAAHANLLAGVDSMRQVLAQTPADTVLVLLPLSFDAGFNQAITALAVGARLRLAEFVFPASAVATAAEAGTTSLTGVPPLWRQLLSVDWPADARRTLRQCASTGGQMTADLAERLQGLFPSAQLVAMYGFTEAFRGAWFRRDLERSRPAGALGTPIPHARLAVIDERGEPCPPHQPGEIVQAGALVTLGYWNNPAATARRFTELAWRTGEPVRVARSGDLGYTTSDGEIVYSGRLDEMIKTSGYRVSPAEIEDVARASGLVGEAVAVGLPDTERGEIVALAVSYATEPSDDGALLRHLRRELPNYMVPRIVQGLTRLPALANGKIDRQAVRESLLARAGEATCPAANASRTP
jgi:amino acid adenylation domain-containing protein